MACCEECGGYCKDEYELCWSCNQEATEAAEEMVSLGFEDVVRESDKAWLIAFGDRALEWVPKSQCRIDGKVLWAPRWLIDKKDLEGYEV